MHTSANTDKTGLNHLNNLDKSKNNVNQSEDYYVVYLVETLNPEKSAEAALLLAEKMNISISKIMHLLSRKRGPISKPTSKAKAIKLAKVLESVGVKTKVAPQGKLLPKPNSLPQKRNQAGTKTSSRELKTEIKAQGNVKANSNETTEANIKVDLDNILDRINANAKESKERAAALARKKARRRNRSLLLLGLMTAALGITYLLNSPQISEFAQGIISPVKAESSQKQPEVIETNLSSNNLRKLSTADLMALVQAGSPKAQYELAYRYGAQGDYDSAVKWLFPIANNGLADAQYLLGLYFQYGHGVEQDIIKSQIWYTKAAAQGVEEAQRQLDLMFLKNDGNNDLLSSANQTKSSDDIFSIAKTASPSQLLLRLEPNQNLNQKDAYGQTALMYAASQNTAEAVQILIYSGADPNIQSDDGWTALMYAARDNPEVIKTLLANQADPDLLNSNGKTALDIAKENFENAEEFFVLDDF